MRKFLISFLLLITTQWLFGAIQAIPRTVYPSFATLGWAGMSTGNYTINDTTDKAAFVIEVPTTGTLTSVQFSTGTITTGENANTVRLETIDASGNPSGTLIDDPTNLASGTIDIANGDDNVALACPINGGTGVSVTAGNMIAVVFAAGGAGLNGGVFRYAGTNSTGGYSIPSAQDYNIGSAAAWTKAKQSRPFLALNIGGWTAPHGCLGGLTGGQSSDPFQSPAERGALINLPVSVRSVGIVASVSMAAATTVKFQLWTPITGTPISVAASNAVDTDAAGLTGNGLLQLMFTSAYTIAANTDYIAAVSPQGAVNVSLGYMPANVTYDAAYPGGSTFKWYGRAAGGSTNFSVTGTRVPQVGIVIDGIDSGGSAGKGIISAIRTPDKQLSAELREKILWVR